MTNRSSVHIRHQLDEPDSLASSRWLLATNASGPAELSSDLVGCDVEIEKKK